MGRYDVPGTSPCQILMQLIVIRIALVLLCSGIAVFFSWASHRAFRERRRWLRDAVVLPGRVIAIKPRHLRGRQIGSRSTLYAPVVSFQSPDGERTFTSDTAQYPCPYVVGQTVSVRYLAGNAEPAELDTEVRSLLFPLAIVVLALVFLAAAAAVALLSKHP